MPRPNRVSISGVLISREPRQERAQNLVFRSTDVIGAVLVDGEVGAIPAGAKVLTAAEVVTEKEDDVWPT